MSDLSKRVLVSLIFMPVLLLALYFEGIPIFLMFLFVSILGAQEYREMMTNTGNRLSLIWLVLSPLFYCAWVFFPNLEFPILWLVIFIAFIQALVTWDVSVSIPRMYSLIFGIIYTAMFPAMIVKIAWYHEPSKILLALILMIWIVDTVAYFVGMRFGKMRGITQVSPKKSREGFIAGVLAPFVALLILYASGFAIVPWPQMLVISIAAGVFGQLGDLLESMIKRFGNVKDSSHLIPGHGGVLDRTDSILLAGAFLYSALKIINM
ncbi:MAG: phosphatidate cytidylyltransferase [Candidatus Cloacimonetes bacterium]|nr:phosphatidate cytidylyltransferase [Candidatus Cloacimonadota bacterium]HOA29330.1 phosphatidate cytidylyltransferase [Candidatus Cloacimonadota bacterium]